ncbi:hypothetical protein MMC18_006340 [Xylographa bjoerkii]|nr:hypothetical protein [Xylographa bjoerkii]
MKNSGYQLTYGVEIEFVLVFHEKLIYAQLAHNRGHQISFNDDYRPSDAEINGWFEKILSPEVRAQINPAPQVYRQTRPQYLAWGVKLRGLERPNPTEATYSEDKKLRTYKSEHLYIAQEILRSAAQNEALQYWNTTFPSDTRVSVGPTPDEWHLRKEAVIEALTQTELEHYLATSKKCFARDGPTSEQRSKRHLSQDISPISGSAPKKQKLTQAPFSIYSSSQSNDSNQENITPQKESMTASKSNNPQSSSSSGPQNPFAQGSNTAPLDLTQAFGATMASSPQGSSINASYTPTPAQRPGLNSRVQVSESTQQSQPANQQDSSTFGAPFSLVSFYDPKIAARDRKNRTLDEILGWDDDRLEREHDYMQLLFPLPEPSTHNPYAPVVDELTFRAFRTRKDLEDQVLRSLDRMYQFFGYSRDGPIVTKNENYIIASRRWNEATSHNHQRIIRIIRSLRILGVRRESHNLFRTLSQGRGVGSSTKQRWHDAVRLPLWVVPGDRTDLRVSRPFLDESYVVLPLEPPTSTDAKTSNTPPSQNPPLGWQQSTTSAPTGQPNTTAADLPISFITVTTPDHTAPSRPPKTFNETISRPAATVDQGTTSDPEARLPETSECKYKNVTK